jgi:hypothetical protein
VASGSDSTVRSLATEFCHLRERYEENRILLPESLCRKINDLINLIALAFETGARPDAGPSLNQQLAEFEAALEREVRMMLGVESEPPVPAKPRRFSALRRRINDLTLRSSRRAADVKANVKTVHE